MKRTLPALALLLVLLLTPFTTSAKVKYRGFVDVVGGYGEASHGEDNTNWSITTTHGLQFSKNVFVGLGGGVNFLNDYYYYSDNDGYDRYAVGLLYARLRFDFPKHGASHKVVPYVQIDTGIFNVYEETNFYGGLSGGIRLSLYKSLAMNIGLSYSGFASGYSCYDGGSSWEEDGSGYLIGLNVGIEF